MPTLGNKHECFKCEVKFYDLGRSEIICPSCGTDQAEADADEESASPNNALKAVADKTEEAPPEKEAAPAEEPAEAEESKADAADGDADVPQPDDEVDEAFEGEEEEDEGLLDDD